MHPRGKADNGMEEGLLKELDRIHIIEFAETCAASKILDNWALNRFVCGAHCILSYTRRPFLLRYQKAHEIRGGLRDL